MVARRGMAWRGSGRDSRDVVGVPRWRAARRDIAGDLCRWCGAVPQGRGVAWRGVAWRGLRDVAVNGKWRNFYEVREIKKKNKREKQKKTYLVEW